MSISNAARCAVLAALVGGCAGDTAHPVAVVTAETSFAAPQDCTRADPAWVPLPDRDVTRADVARNYDRNKRQYAQVLGWRRVCRAAITTHQKGSSS